MNAFHIILILAWRNLWRNHRRTIVMVSAIMVGVWAMIFMTALMRGMVNEMIRNGIQSLPGHVQVHHPDFLNDPSINNTIAEPLGAQAEAYNRAGFVAWSSRLKVPAIITSERDSRGVTLFAIDPAAERSMTFLANDIVEGEYLQSSNDRGIIIGRKLAKDLDTELGKRIVIMSQDPDNEIADRGFRIVGIFKASLENYESTMIFAGKSTIQSMLNVPGQVSEIAVLAQNYRNIEKELEQVIKLAGKDVSVLPWYEVDSYLGTMMAVMDGFVLVWMVVIFLALSFGLINTIVMAVFERVREIGLMMALGMRPGSIIGQIVIESILLLVIGLGLGNILALASNFALRDGIDLSVVAEGMAMMGASGMLRPELTLNDIVLANIVVLILGFLASLSPAWRASRYDPIEAITKV